MKPKEKQRELIVIIMKADEQSGMYTTREKTAVQMFWDKIALKLSFEQLNEFVSEFKKAKKREKEQISMAHLEGAMKMHHKEYESGDQYYTETYEQ